MADLLISLKAEFIWSLRSPNLNLLNFYLCGYKPSSNGARDIREIQSALVPHQKNRAYGNNFFTEVVGI